MSDRSISGRVLRSQSGQYWVQTDGGVVHCTLRGRLKRERKARTDLAVIGDLVRIEPLEAAGEGVIEEVLPRENRFARRQPGSRGQYKEDVLVANLDWLFVVLACGTPPPNPRLLDRFLVIAELDGIAAAVVANKIDQVERRDAEAIFEPYAALGYPVFYASAEQRLGIDPLRAALAGKVAAFVGPSGVGKSSLLNAIEPGLAAAVGELSESLDKGRHTTRVAELHPLAGGGWIADTPGIRELASFDLPVRELARCFPELAPFARACRFPDCVHVREPGCAVREALDAGAVRPERYDSYVRILRGEDR